VVVCKYLTALELCEARGVYRVSFLCVPAMPLNVYIQSLCIVDIKFCPVYDVIREPGRAAGQGNSCCRVMGMRSVFQLYDKMLESDMFSFNHLGSSGASGAPNWVLFLG